MQTGELAYVPHVDRVVRLLATTDDGWRCDDGWVHVEDRLRPLTEANPAAVAAHMNMEIGGTMLAADFERWERER